MIRYNRKHKVFVYTLSVLLISTTALLSLSGVFAQQNTSGETGTMLAGTNLDLSVSPPIPFNKSVDNNMTLSFLPKGKALEGSSFSPGKIDHLDYLVSVTLNGNQIWGKQFHDHDGNLILQIHPSGAASISVTGGAEDAGRSTTGPYIVDGPIFVEEGNYDISAKIVGVEFNPLPSPLSDTFSLQVVS